MHSRLVGVCEIRRMYHTIAVKKALKRILNVKANTLTIYFLYFIFINLFLIANNDQCLYTPWQCIVQLLKTVEGRLTMEDPSPEEM